MISMLEITIFQTKNTVVYKILCIMHNISLAAPGTSERDSMLFLYSNVFVSSNFPCESCIIQGSIRRCHVYMPRNLIHQTLYACFEGNVLQTLEDNFLKTCILSLYIHFFQNNGEKTIVE